MGDPLSMQGVDVFCERCGALQPRPEANTPRSAGVLARRVLDAVGITESHETPTEEWLRLCLSCRGYSCPTCWNEPEGVCQTCAPLPEPQIVAAAQEEPEPEPMVLPLVLPPEPEPEPVYVAPPEPEPVYVAPPEPEPVYVAPPQFEPEPAHVVEPAPEPAVVAPPAVTPPAPEPRPAAPRMPVLPLPPPRPANAPVLPLPPLPDYPVAPQIAFSAHADSTAGAAAVPAFEPHMLLAPPSTTPSPGQAGLRPCGNCQLALSARAHFCRRCGTAQPN